jgi:hypothetical protein
VRRKTDPLDRRSVLRAADGERARLLKIAARITETASRVRIAFAAACPEAELFRYHLQPATGCALTTGASAPTSPIPATFNA